MTTYRTKDGDVADAIAKDHLGSEALVVDLFAANPGLAALGPVLPAGIDVTLPDVAPATSAPRVRLWGAAT